MKLTESKKELLREFVNRICEQCKKSDLETGTLEIHRLKRGNQGGTYTLNNLKILCQLNYQNQVGCY